MARKFDFKIKEIQLFTPDEIEMLTIHGSAFEDLMNGVRQPKTPGQERFLEVCRGNAEPETSYERAWHKYLFRLKFESDPSNQETMGPKKKFVDDGIGGSRDYHKKRAGSQGRYFNRRK